MSELRFPLSQEDADAYNREIGIEAALTINAIITSVGESLETAHDMREAGELAPHIGSLLVRAEETADRHIGRRDENDKLFVSQSSQTETPKTLELFTSAGEEALLADSELERRHDNRERLESGIAKITEPLINALRDKLPEPKTAPAPVEKRRWLKTTKTPQAPINRYEDWEQLDGSATTHKFNLAYIEDAGTQRLKSFYYSSKQADALGSMSSVLFTNGNITTIRYGDRAGEQRMPSDFSEHLDLKCNQGSLWGVSLETDNTTYTLQIPIGHANGFDNMHTSFVYDDNRDLFVHAEGTLPPIKPAVALQLLERITSAIPTLDFTPTTE